MKINRAIVKAAILLLALTDCGVGATTAALATIGAAFPNVSPSLIQMIASVPALFFAIIPTVFYAPITKVFRKRTILVIGVILFVIGGLAPTWINSSIYVILVFRAILGVGLGLITPLGVDLICDLFEGDEQRNMLGYNGAMLGLSALMFQTLGGFLSQVRWEYTFLAYLPAIAFFIFALIFIPEPEKREVKVAKDVPKVKAKLPMAAIFYNIIIFFNGMFFYVAVTNSAFVLITDKIAQPYQIGLMFNGLTFSSILIGLIFGRIFKKIKYYVLTLCLIFGALGLFLCGTTNSIVVFTVGLFFVGFTLSGVISTGYSKMSDIVPPSIQALGIGLVVTSMNLGEFFQPLVFNFFTVPGRQPFIIGAILFIVLAVISVIFEKVTNKKSISKDIVKPAETAAE